MIIELEIWRLTVVVLLMFACGAYSGWVFRAWWHEQIFDIDGFDKAMAWAPESADGCDLCAVDDAPLELRFERGVGLVPARRED